MEHRGACSADNDSGDGAGLMTQIPWKLLKKDFPALNESTMGSVCPIHVAKPVEGICMHHLKSKPDWAHHSVEMSTHENLLHSYHNHDMLQST
jgi:glutamate synthase domain-containing protein 1